MKNIAASYPGDLGGMPFLHVATGTDAEFNSRLRDFVLQQEQTLCGTETVRHGRKEGLSALWETYNVLKWPNRECELLEGMFLNYFMEYLKIADKKYGNDFPHVIQCWANVTRGPSYAEFPHQHNQNPLNVVGVYYVSGDYGFTGALNFFKEEKGHMKEIFHLMPKVGDLILFPAPVFHGRGFYIDKNPRISIAFDIRFEGDPKKNFIDFF